MYEIKCKEFDYFNVIPMRLASHLDMLQFALRGRKNKIFYCVRNKKEIVKSLKKYQSELDSWKKFDETAPDYDYKNSPAYQHDLGKVEMLEWLLNIRQSVYCYDLSSKLKETVSIFS